MLIKALGIDLHNVPVGLADVDLPVLSGGMGLDDHVVRIIDVGIFPVYDCKIADALIDPKTSAASSLETAAQLDGRLPG